MVQIIEQSGNIAGRIGKGFAQGLSEQLPDEIKRGRLSGGIKSLVNQDLANKSPLEQLAAIYSIPNMTPEIASLAQQQIRNQARVGSEQAKGVPVPKANVSAQTNRVMQNNNATSGNEEEDIPSLSPQSSNYGIALDEDEIEDKARAKWYANPSQFANFQDYVDKEKDIDQRRVNKELKFEERQLEADNLLDKRLSEYLQKNNLTKDVPGTVLSNARTKLKNLINNGATVPQAVDQINKELLPFVKARNDLASATSVFTRWQEGSVETRRKIEEARKGYEKLKAIEEFKDDLVSQGMGDAYANSLAYPIKNNKQINNYVANLPKIKPNDVSGSGIYEGGKAGKSKKTIDEAKIAKDIAPNLTKEDSILSIALALKGRGYNTNEFIKEISNNIPKKDLTERQQEDLRKSSNIKPNLMDIFIWAKSGLDPLELMP